MNDHDHLYTPAELILLMANEEKEEKTINLKEG